MILENRIPIKYFLEKIKWELPIITVFSTSIHFLSVYLSDYVNIPISISAFLGTAIALLLSFKLSQSYDRWWEARKIWGEIVNDSRSFVIQLKSFTNNKDNDSVKRMAYRQIAWSYSLGQKLRGFNALDNIENFISKDEIEKMKKNTNSPLSMLDKNADEINRLKETNIINQFQQIQLDKTIVRLVASMGKTERIKNTIFPKTYRMALHLFVYVFLTFLSFSLTDLHSLVEIPILVVIAIPFLLLEKVALSIQDPFENKPSDTAMTSIANTIEINIKELLDEENIPKPLATETFYKL